MVLSSGNNAPWGMWSDDTTMWVAQRQLRSSKLYAYDLPVAECPGQLVSSTEYVPRPTGCPRLTLLDFGDVKVDWDGVSDAIGYAVRYYMDVDGVAKWYTDADPYPGVGHESNFTADPPYVTIPNLPREANVVYFSFRSLDAATQTYSDWSPYNLIWINDPLELEGAAPGAGRRAGHADRQQPARQARVVRGPLLR